MILGIIIGVFIGGCVGVVIMAIVQMAKEDEPVTKNDGKGIEFPCPKCGKGEHHVGYLNFLFCPECGYRTTRGFDLNAATREWNSASVLKHNDSRLPKNCYQCLSTTQYGRVLECPAYKKLEEDPLSTGWVNNFGRGKKE